MSDSLPQGYLNKNSDLLSLCLRLLDVFLIMGTVHLCGWLLGYIQESPLDLLLLSLVLVALFDFISSSFAFYRSWRGQPLIDQILVLLKVETIVFFFVFLIEHYLFEQGREPLLLVSTLAAFVSLAFSRLIIRTILNFIRSKGINTRKTAIYAATETGITMVEQIQKSFSLGMTVTGIFDDRASTPGRVIEHPLLSGSSQDLLNSVNSNDIDIVYIALPFSAHQRITDIVNSLTDSTVAVYVVPDLSLEHLLKSRWTTLNHIPVINVFDHPFLGFSAWAKRLQDIVISSMILFLISPLLLIISIGVKLSSHGPVFFKQARYGVDGHKIKVWKFRSMRTLENGEVVNQATRKDPRITAFGRFLRKTSLDELPQFINVFMGHMSIVGPRPHAVAHNEWYRKKIKGYMLRHAVKPGITGWAQINGWRGETENIEKMEKRIEFDLWYIKNWSHTLDMKIIFLTIFKGFINKNAF